MGSMTSILCVGDSITFGEHGSSYSLQLPIEIDHPVDVTKLGFPGFGVRDLTKQMLISLDKGSQDFVLIMGGTNDLLGTPAPEILTLLKLAWRAALERGSRVVALTILEMNLNPEARANQETLNILIRRAVEDEKNDKLLFYDACGCLPTQDSRPDLWHDDVHPAPAGHMMMGTGIGRFLNKVILNKDNPSLTIRTLFRPCIDIHSGKVKQIVGGTLSEDAASPQTLQTNYVSDYPAQHFAELYKRHNLEGGHVIMLGPNCSEAAKAALRAWPGKLQIGGGINDSNAMQWIDKGAEKVILTSWLFPDGVFSLERLQRISELVGTQRLVVDLSCRANKGRSGWTVAMNKWQTLTDLEITRENLNLLRTYCSEFLIHAADVEGLQMGVDQHLVDHLGLWAAATPHSPFRLTYAGGARSVKDLIQVNRLSGGYVDLTIGSALDIFGGSGATLEECIAWNKGVLGI